MTKTSASFKTLVEAVQRTEIWAQMSSTVENSEWHREANVAVHSMMTVQHYIDNIQASRTEKQSALTLVALLFHDFGKPAAEEIIENKDGSGTRRRYAGHEQVSATEFWNFICDNAEIRQILVEMGLTWEALRQIRVMIEHHLPYGLKNPDKRKKLKRMLDTTLHGDLQVFYDMLVSDAAGRISDDHETKMRNVLEWIAEFDTMDFSEPFKKKLDLTCTVLVGLPGLGKSTYVQKYLKDHVVISSDELAVLMFKEKHDVSSFSDESKLYKAAHRWAFSDGEKDLNEALKNRMQYAIDNKKNVVIDRTNMSRKSRGKFIEPFRQKGYLIQSVEFVGSWKMSVARQLTRHDKAVPTEAILRMSGSYETPWYGVEVDSFLLHLSNLDA